MSAVVYSEVKSLSQSLRGGLEYGICLFYSCIVTLGHEHMLVDLSHQILSNYLCDNVYKSLHDIVLLFLFLLQREKRQFAVSLLIVHLMKVASVCACVELV